MSWTFYFVAYFKEPKLDLTQVHAKPDILAKAKNTHRSAHIRSTISTFSSLFPHKWAHLSTASLLNSSHPPLPIKQTVRSSTSGGINDSLWPHSMDATFESISPGYCTAAHSLVPAQPTRGKMTRRITTSLPYGCAPVCNYSRVYNSQQCHLSSCLFKLSW